MFEHIVESIICSEFDKRYRGGEMGKNQAMLIKFSLSLNYEIEDGHRNLHILIFGGGSNYIGVYAKADWVVTNGNSEETGTKYINGETPFVLYGYHDSCWRDAVGNILREFRERITSIDWLFGGWKIVNLTDEAQQDLYMIRKATPGYGGEGKRVRISELEFNFPTYFFPILSRVSCTGISRSERK